MPEYQWIKKIIKKLKEKRKLKIISNLPLRTVSLFDNIKKKINPNKIFYIEADYIWGRLNKLFQWRSKISNYSLTLGAGIHVIDLIMWLLNYRTISVSSLEVSEMIQMSMWVMFFVIKFFGNSLLSSYFLLLVIVLLSFNMSMVIAEQEHKHHKAHSNHSDALLILLRHKIALQKLQDKYRVSPEQSNLKQQGIYFKNVMPILNQYMSTPRSYYLSGEMYHESLENRAAMLTDFTALLIQYQQLIVQSQALKSNLLN